MNRLKTLTASVLAVAAILVSATIAVNHFAPASRNNDGFALVPAVFLDDGWEPFDFFAAWGAEDIEGQNCTIIFGLDGDDGRDSGGIGGCNGTFSAGFWSGAGNYPDGLPAPHQEAILSDATLRTLDALKGSYLLTLDSSGDPDIYSREVAFNFGSVCGVLSTPNGYSEVVSGTILVATFIEDAADGTSFEIPVVYAYFTRQWDRLEDAEAFVRGREKLNAQIALENEMRATNDVASGMLSEKWLDEVELPENFSLECLNNNMDTFAACIETALDEAQVCEVQQGFNWADCALQRNLDRQNATNRRDACKKGAIWAVIPYGAAGVGTGGTIGGLCGLAAGGPAGSAVLGGVGASFGGLLFSIYGVIKTANDCDEQYELDREMANQAFWVCKSQADGDFQVCMQGVKARYRSCLRDMCAD